VNKVPIGHVNLVLHAHLPFVYNGYEPHLLEERWFFEALTESYLPLLLSMEQMKQENISFAMTLSLSPTLLAMLDHPVLSKRYTDYLQRLLRLAANEEKRTTGDEPFNQLAHFYRKRLEHLYTTYVEQYHGDLIAQFAKLSDSGHLELITTCATHGYLPLIRTKEAVNAQIRVGLDAFAARFGFYPRGMWLPECGYFTGLDTILAHNKVEYVFADTHGVKNAWPTPNNDVYAPVMTPAGVAVFARDPETSSQVWSLQSGYPGDPDYREYYRDIGFELDENYIHSFLPYPVRVNTGLKYWRVTGNNLPKEPYNPHWAAAKAKSHAENFHYNRERQLQHLTTVTDQPPLVTAPYDAELFGHWWFEGPDFLKQVFRKGSDHRQIFTYSTPSRYLDTFGCNHTAEIFHSSWGEGGYSHVWMNPKNDWLYWETHQAEACLASQISNHPIPEPQEKRIINQMGRELLLAQSSDWAFMLNAGTTNEYASKRALTHLAHFKRLNTMLITDDISVTELSAMEADVSGLFPGIQATMYTTKPVCTLPSQQQDPAALMLSWEYPPHIMGGLARHVDDLSQALSREDQPVSILTSKAGNDASSETYSDVCVYRVAPYQKAGKEIDFHDWVVQLNLVFFNRAQQIIPVNQFAVLHAHDWLVGAAALGIKRFWRLPLVATIHATEYGRNGGLFTPLQKKIHAHEQRLVEGADRVICCSEYMAREVSRLFKIPSTKIVVIQNGVDPKKVKAEPLTGAERRKYARDDEAIIYFVGRLVREKGVEVLLKALPSVIAAYPKTKVIISGKGPMMDLLKKQVQDYGITDKVIFTGFVTDDERNRLLTTADIAVFPSLYEPFGIVALEAMVAQTPVIVSDVGGMGEVVSHGHDGLKCPPGNDKALSASIRTLLADQRLRAHLVRQALHKVITEYSWDTLAEQTKQVYHDVWEDARFAKTVD
jgi:1,4-alpha-glucan branching enzyme